MSGIVRFNKKIPQQSGAVARVIKPSPGTLDDLADEWLKSCQGRDIASTTIHTYRTYTNRFLWWWNEYSGHAERIGAYPDKITDREMIDFVVYLRIPQTVSRWGEPIRPGKEKLMPGTIEVFGQILTTFFNWLEDRHYIEKSPLRSKDVTFKPASKKGQTPAPKALDTDALRTVFAYLNSKAQNYAWIRNRAIIYLLLDSGIRRGELLSIRWKDMDIQAGRCEVDGKTGRRMAYFTRFTADAIEDYSYRFRAGQHSDKDIPGDPDLAPFWLCSDNSFLSGSSVGELLSVIKRDTGVAIHAHKLRHTFATHMAGEVTPFELQKLMGHSNIQTTMRYVHLAQSVVEKAYRGKGPLSTMDIGQGAVNRRRGRPRKE